MNSTLFYVLTKNALIIQMTASLLRDVFSITKISSKKTRNVLTLKAKHKITQKNASLILSKDAMMEFADLTVSI